MLKKPIYLFAIMTLLLTGCMEAENKSQNSTQKFIDEIESTLSEQGHPLCFYIGKAQFPYTAKKLTYPVNSRADVWVNNELNRRLELFSQLGLLKQTQDEKDEQKRTYQFTDLDADTVYRNGSFCFGDVSIDNFRMGNDGVTSIHSKITYNIDTIPAWVNDDRFIQYFYKQRRANDQYYNLTVDYSYPNLTNGHFPNKLEAAIDLIKLADGNIILDGEEAILETFYHNRAKSKWDKRYHTYAYYDKTLADYMIKHSIREGKLIESWGEADPILLAKAPVSKNLARSNNIVTMFYYLDHALTDNAIKSISGTEGNRLIKGERDANFNIHFDQDRLLLSYQSHVKQYTSELKRIISRTTDDKMDSKIWTFYDDFSMQVPSLNQNSIHPLATDKWTKKSVYIVYQADKMNKLVSQHFGSGPFVPLSINYDAQDRIELIEDMTLKYNDNNQIIRITQKDKNFDITYDKKGRLTEITTYTGKDIKNASVCHYSNHNDQGDWLKKSCSDYQDAVRTIEYYQ